MATVNNVISRSNVIKGTSPDSFARAGGPLRTRSVTLNSVAIQGLDSAPVVLLPVPPSGIAYLVHGVYSDKVAGEYGGGATVTVNYQDASTTQIASIPRGHFRLTSQDSQWAARTALTGTPTGQAPPGVGIGLNTGTAFTGEGGDVTITVVYIEVAR